MKGKCAVLFDCDGTLIDSLSHAVDSFNIALAEQGEAPRSAETIKRYFGMSADRIFRKILPDEKQAERAFGVYLEYQAKLAQGMSLHAGIRDLLEKFRQANVPMAIVTGRHSRDLDNVLEPHDIARYFTIMVCDDQLERSKPAPDGILLAAQHLGVDPAHTFYVGDSASDIEAAHAAGSHGIAALWDLLAHETELRATSPRELARAPDDIWKYYMKISQS